MFVQLIRDILQDWLKKGYVQYFILINGSKVTTVLDDIKELQQYYAPVRKEGKKDKVYNIY